MSWPKRTSRRSPRSPTPSTKQPGATPGTTAGDPCWEDQDTPFRRRLHTKLAAAGFECAADAAIMYAPANRYHGLDGTQMGLIATLTGASYDTVRAAHKADLAAWSREQQLRDHP